MVKVGLDADLILLDFTQPHLMPCHNVMSHLAYCVNGHDVVMTMVRGKILYSAGKYHTIDLTEALYAALLMETPFVVLCREDCKGLCPVCGENLNERDCGHAAQIEEERLASSPFAALRNLKLDD